MTETLAHFLKSLFSEEYLDQCWIALDSEGASAKLDTKAGVTARTFSSIVYLSLHEPSLRTGSLMIFACIIFIIQ